MAAQLVRRYGRDAVAWQGLESHCRHWFGEDAAVAYFDTGSAWVAVGSPWCAPARTPAVASAFVAAARARGRRVCFFGAERVELLGDWPAKLLGEMPIFAPSQWPTTVRTHRRLREQLRRARAKGVVVRRVEAGELAPGTALRARVDALAAAWLGTRHLEPMGFLVALEPFLLPDEHRYYVAERHGQLLLFASLVPVPMPGGWLVEDVVRGERVPNGTTELLLDATIRDAAGESFVTLGLTPLTGRVPFALRAARALGTPLYDFRALAAFRRRLHPAAWVPVWLVHAPRRGSLALLDSLRAFARGPLLAFALRSLGRRPSGIPWLLSVPLLPWTVALAVLVVKDDGSLLGYPPPALAAFVVFDAVLACLLFRAAHRPRRSRLAWLAAAAGADAAASLAHVLAVGLGPDAVTAGARLLSLLAPALATPALAWAATRARR